MEQPDLVDARTEIHDRLLSYTRGIDRLDTDLVLSAFHPGAQLCDYGPDPLSVEDFASYAIQSLRERFVATQHRVSNIRIEIDGGLAVLEAYVLAYHVQESDDGQILHTFNGRYIDTFTLLDGHWKISERFLRNDWSKIEDITDEMAGSSVWVKGRRDVNDPIYDF